MSDSREFHNLHTHTSRTHHNFMSPPPLRLNRRGPMGESGVDGAYWRPRQDVLESTSWQGCRSTHKIMPTRRPGSNVNEGYDSGASDRSYLSAQDVVVASSPRDRVSTSDLFARNGPNNFYTTGFK